jgi:tRNA threonylcarbamoyladenosine biosynthesis protein TsaE
MVLYSENTGETKKAGEVLAAKLKKGDIVAFIGQLGSGKTTMIKGMVKYLTGKQAISPSYVIINEYPGKVTVYHFDLYRLENTQQLHSIGWEEYIDKGIILIEWADKILNVLPEKAMLVKIFFKDHNKRKIEIKKGEK